MTRVLAPRVAGYAALELERERALEGDELDAVLELDVATGTPRLEVLLELPRGIELADGDDPLAIRTRDEDTRTLAFRLRCARWGGYRVGRVLFRARDRFDFLSWEWQEDLRAPLPPPPSGRPRRRARHPRARGRDRA